MEQREVWNKVAKKWHEYKLNQKPINEVLEFLKDKKGNILDLGCGTGRYFVKSEGKIHAVDFSEEMIGLAEKHVKTRGLDVKTHKAEAHELPFKDGFFDHAIFIAALHCISDPKQRKESLEELFRVLKKNGTAIITVWSRNQRRIKNKPKETTVPWTIEGKKYERYYYIYDKKELETLLKKVGFKIISVKEDKNIIAVVQRP